MSLDHSSPAEGIQADPTSPQSRRRLHKGPKLSVCSSGSNSLCVGGQRREDPAGLGPLFQPDTGALGIAGLPLWVRELFSIVDTFSCVPESCS